MIVRWAKESEYGADNAMTLICDVCVKDPTVSGPSDLDRHLWMRAIFQDPMLKEWSVNVCPKHEATLGLVVAIADKHFARKGIE